MKKLFIGILAMALVFGMSMGVMADNNDAAINQTGNNQDATIGQTGNYHEAKINQLSENDGPQKASVTQLGDSNLASVFQHQYGGGSAGLNTAEAYQDGTDNELFQVSVAPGYNSGQDLTGRQFGQENILNQTIAGGYTNSLFARQDGSENEATQYLNASHSHASIWQDGSENEATQTILGSNHGYMGSEVYINQDGEDNEATQYINGGGSSTQTNATISQIGNRNEASQNILGSDNSSTIVQNGDDNEASVSQN